MESHLQARGWEAAQVHAPGHLRVPAGLVVRAQQADENGSKLWKKTNPTNRTMVWILNPPFRHIRKELESDFPGLLDTTGLWLTKER